MRYIIGIDNGLNGAIVVLNDKREIEIYDTPVLVETRGKAAKRKRYDNPAVPQILRKYAKKSSLPVKYHKDSIVEEGDYVIAFLEQAHPMPKNAGGSPQGNFMTGEGFGMYKDALTILEIPFEEVHSKTWQTHFFKGVHGKDLKKKSVDTARKLFPAQQEEFVGQRGGLRDGRSDAALIAEFGLRKLNGRDLSPTVAKEVTDESN